MLSLQEFCFKSCFASKQNFRMILSFRSINSWENVERFTWCYPSENLKILADVKGYVHEAISRLAHLTTHLYYDTYRIYDNDSIVHFSLYLIYCPRCESHQSWSPLKLHFLHLELSVAWQLLEWPLKGLSNLMLPVMTLYLQFCCF